jgi:hypothetical protein
VGTLAGVALHLAGFSPVSELATAAVGTFTGVLLGPVVDEKGIAKPWAWAAVPIPLLAGIYGVVHCDGPAQFFSFVGGAIVSAATAVGAAAHQGGEFNK